MGMRVDIRRLAVGSPAGMAYTQGSMKKPSLKLGTYLFFQKSQGPLVLADYKARIPQRRNPRRIITPVLQLFKTLDENRNRFPVPDISDNTAHFSR